MKPFERACRALATLELSRNNTDRAAATDWQDYGLHVLAVIDAIREPTARMINASHGHDLELERVTFVRRDWHALLDTVISEK